MPRDAGGELYLAMELMDSDLHDVIQSKQPLDEPRTQCLMMQLLLGVGAMHDVGVLHRDLKPGNCLVSRDCRLVVTDFGLARVVAARGGSRRSLGEGTVAAATLGDAGIDGGADDDAGGGDDELADHGGDDDLEMGGGPRAVMTEYVVTRWYRCPELLLAPNTAYVGRSPLAVWSRRAPVCPSFSCFSSRSRAAAADAVLRPRAVSERNGLAPTSNGLASSPPSRAPRRAAPQV